MEHGAINVHQDAKCNPGTLTVGEALNAFPDLKHAGEAELRQLLENPDQAPVFLLQKSQKDVVNALLFAGTIKKDANKKDYVTAVYAKCAKGLVTEKYWLSYPMPENLCFALVD